MVELCGITYAVGFSSKEKFVRELAYVEDGENPENRVSIMQVNVSFDKSIHTSIILSTVSFMLLLVTTELAVFSKQS